MLLACSGDPGATATAGSTAASTAAPTSAVASTATTALGSERAYPDGVRAVDERPSGEPIPAMIFLDGGPEPIPGFGTLKLVDAHSAPDLSEFWIRWGPDNGRESYVRVTTGDRFEIDGFVFEVVSVDEFAAQLDAWGPDQLAPAANDREYPDGVTAVAERPDGVPRRVVDVVAGGPTTVADFGKIKVLDAYEPPDLSLVMLRRFQAEDAGGGLGPSVDVEVTAGDRFDLNGFVFEVVRIDSSGGEFDVWTPDQLADS